MTDEDTPTYGSGRINRRSLLTATGASIAAATTIGAVSGKPPSFAGGGPPSVSRLPEGVVSHAKYEVDSGSGATFVPEADHTRGDTLGVLDRDAVVEFTDVTENDEGEVTAFCWDAGPYHLDRVVVKHGRDVTEFDGGTSGCVTVEKHAVSNVVFGKKIFFQADLITGTDFETPPLLANEEEDKLLRAILGNTVDGITLERSIDSPLSDEDLAEHLIALEDLTGDAAVASADVDVSAGTSFETATGEGLSADENEVVVSLAVYERPGPSGKVDAYEQTLVDTISVTLEWSDASGASASLTASLPE